MPTRDADRNKQVTPIGYGTGAMAPGKTAGEIDSNASATGSHAVAADMLSPEERHFRISLAAYRRAEARGFVAGTAMEDWLAAEREVDAETDG